MLSQNLNKWKTPAVLIALMVMSYGLMLPWLGYSFDEWHFIYYSTRGLEGISELFHYDGHPQAIWSYILSFRLLGYNPIYWHIYSFVLRGIAVISFWSVLQELWPNCDRQNFLASALFAIYPFFTLQIFPITFYEVWLGFILINLSFLFTVKAIRNPKNNYTFFILAILFRIGFIFTKEYTWFLELMRPAFIWFAIQSNFSIKKKFTSVFKIWLPYLLIFLLTIIWRGFFYTPTRLYFRVQHNIFGNPLQTIFNWTMDLIPDVLIVLVTSWYRILNAEDFYLIRPFNVLVLILGILSTILVYIYLKKINRNGNEYNQEIIWHQQAFWVGIPSILFGIMPFYIANYSIHLTEFPLNARFALGMLPGIALVFSATLEYFISKTKNKLFIIAVLLSLTITWHIRYTNDYRKIWIHQSNILEQLTWRVPGLDEKTALFIYTPSPPQIDKESTAYIALAGDFPTSMAINSIYQANPQKQGSQLSYWVYSSIEPLQKLPKTIPLETSHATTYFEGNTNDSLGFYYASENGQCLHLIQSGDELYKQYPKEIREIAPYLSAQSINPENGQQYIVRNQILGNGENNWCYYYETADLARQYQKWENIVDLWKISNNKNLRPAHGIEYIPFIDGFAHTGEWEKALEFTKTARKLSKAMESILCPLWQDINRSMPSSIDNEQATKQAQALLQCTP